MITPEELHNFCKSLDRENEVSCRSSASRAYYSAFLSAKQACDPPVLERRRGGVHKQFIDRLIHSQNQIEQEIGKLLRETHSIRVRADYHIDQQFNKADSENLIAKAGYVLQLGSDV